MLTIALSISKSVTWVQIMFNFINIPNQHALQIFEKQVLVKLILLKPFCIICFCSTTCFYILGVKIETDIWSKISLFIWYHLKHEFISKFMYDDQVYRLMTLKGDSYPHQPSSIVTPIFSKSFLSKWRGSIWLDLHFIGTCYTSWILKKEGYKLESHVLFI